MDGMLTREEAAERLGMSVDTLDAERRGGHIAFVQRKKNGRVWISEDAIKDYIARATHPVKPEREAQPTLRKRRA